MSIIKKCITTLKVKLNNNINFAFRKFCNIYQVNKNDTYYKVFEITPKKSVYADGKIIKRRLF